MVTNSADPDRTEHYYHDGQSVVEVRNGSDQMIRQNVWGLTYIDELVQTSVKTRHFYALQDANFNVLGVTTHGGKLVERYEYTPYGRRDVYSLGYLRADFDGDGDVDTFDYGAWQAGFGMTEGATAADGDADGDGDVDAFDDGIRQTENGSTLALNDGLVMHPRAMSYRHPLQGIAVCAFGHQGLMHDEATGSREGMIYNRARMLNSRLGRFVQRDPRRGSDVAMFPKRFRTANAPYSATVHRYNIIDAEDQYGDGMSLYQYLQSNVFSRLDPTGLKWIDTPIEYCNAPGHTFVKFGGIGYGFYAESHYNGGANWWDDLRACLLADGVVVNDDRRVYPNAECAKLKVDDQCCDPQTFSEGVEKFLLNEYNKYNPGSSDRKNYNVVFNSCQTWAMQAIRAGMANADCSQDGLWMDTN